MGQDAQAAKPEPLTKPQREKLQIRAEAPGRGLHMAHQGHRVQPCLPSALGLTPTLETHTRAGVYLCPQHPLRPRAGCSAGLGLDSAPGWSEGLWTGSPPGLPAEARAPGQGAEQLQTLPER